MIRKALLHCKREKGNKGSQLTPTPFTPPPPPRIVFAFALFCLNDSICTKYQQNGTCEPSLLVARQLGTLLRPQWSHNVVFIPSFTLPLKTMLLMKDRGEERQSSTYVLINISYMIYIYICSRNDSKIKALSGCIDKLFKWCYGDYWHGTINQLWRNKQVQVTS